MTAVLSKMQLLLSPRLTRLLVAFIFALKVFEMEIAMATHKVLITAGLFFLLVISASVARAADASCAPIVKAYKLAQSQARIHSASDSMRRSIIDTKNPRSPLGDDLATAITFDKNAFSSISPDTFISGKDNGIMEKEFIHALTFFRVDFEKCRPLGNATLAGKSVAIYESGTLSDDPSETVSKYWIDTKTGLPVRLTQDKAFAPEGGGSAGKDPKPSAGTKSKLGRLTDTYGYLFGEDVKAPVLSGPENSLGARLGKLDAAAQATLKLIVKG
jgi:hypothetical protein